MREIKFKYYYSDGKNIFTKVFTLDQIEGSDQFDAISDSLMLRSYRVIDRAQYTGFEDKSGIYIYEKDILSFDDIFVPVTFEDGAFQIIGDRSSGRSPLIQLRCKYYSVAGNIHENPELLEDE